MSGTPDLLTSSGDAKMFTSVASLVAAFAAAGSCEGRITRRVIAHGAAGILQVKLAGNGGAAQDWYFAQDVPEELQCTGFTDTGATLTVSATYPIKVYF